MKHKLPADQSTLDTLTPEEDEGDRRVGGGGESEALESASNFDSGSGGEESGSESTITDSGPEDAAGATHSLHGARGRRVEGSVGSPLGQQSSENGAFDLFISAAEALNHTVPPEVALHDHSYALAPISSMELQGSSGLSLIAAAAAVVSPTLSRSAGTGKFPAIPPVRAPRGRPPNTQRRGANSSSCKLAPTLLSPAGNSIYVPLTDTTKSSFRSRARSAPSDRPRIQLPRTGPSNLRYSISSKAGGISRPILPPASYSRPKEGSLPAGTPGKTSALKSMMASRTQQSSSSNAAFETLVNVAVAASPAELPKSTASSSSTPTATLSISFQNASNSAPSTPDTSHLADGTYSLDVNQAINILALSFAQGASSPSSSGSPQPLLLTQGLGSQPSTLLGTIVSQSLPYQQAGGKAGSPNTVNVLIGHLTSGNSATLSPGSVGSALSEVPGVSRASFASHHEPPSTTIKSRQQQYAVSTASLSSASSMPSFLPSTPPPTAPASTISSPGEDLSNLNLLSSLVAVVANSKAPTPPSHTPLSSTSKGPASPLIGYSMVSPNPTRSVAAPTAIEYTSASAFKATNLPAVLTASTEGVGKRSSASPAREGSAKSKLHEKTSAQVSLNSEQSWSASVRSAAAGSVGLLGSLPHSVGWTLSSHTHQSHMAGNSLAPSHPSPTHSSLSPYPPSAPSIGQQSTLLYTHSLSLPNPLRADASSEEEDHLDCATRGISELSKLLGTADAGTDSLSSSSGSDSSVGSYRASWEQSSSLSPGAVRGVRSVLGSGSPAYLSKGELGNEPSKPFLSGLLESHNPLQQTNASAQHNTNTSNNCGKNSWNVSR